MSALRDKVAAGDEALDVLVMPTQHSGRLSEAQGVVQAPARRSANLGLAVSVNAGCASARSLDAGDVRAALLDSRAIVHATPGATPSGTHMGQLIEQLGIADAMKGKIIHRPALEGGVQLVASGEADIGFYPKSEVVNTEALTRRRAVTGRDPAHDHLRRGGDRQQHARRMQAADFIAFMTEPAHRAAWAHAGFDPPTN